MKCKTAASVGLGIAALLGALAGNGADRGFFGDQPRLQPVKGDRNEQMWLAADAEVRALKYTAVMIDQPEIFLARNSKYRGAKPDDLKVIADELRNAFREEIERAGKYVVDEPDADVLYIRVAIRDVLILTAKRPASAYVPASANPDATRKMRTGITDRIQLGRAKIEAALLDSVTNEPLAAYALTLPADNDVSWDELRAAFSGAGKRVSCRLDNTALPRERWRDCHAIPLMTTKPP